MTTDTADKPKARRKPELPIQIQPIMVSHEIAAAMLAQIGERTLDQLVAEGKITPRQITAKRVGYLRRELEAFAEAAPAVRPGMPRPQAGSKDE